MRLRLPPEYEKSRSGAVLGQGVQYLRCDPLIGTIIEGQSQQLVREVSDPIAHDFAPIAFRYAPVKIAGFGFGCGRCSLKLSGVICDAPGPRRLPGFGICEHRGASGICFPTASATADSGTEHHRHTHQHDQPISVTQAPVTQHNSWHHASGTSVVFPLIC